MKRIPWLILCLLLVGSLCGCGVSGEIYFSAVAVPTAVPTEDVSATATPTEEVPSTATPVPGSETPAPSPAPVISPTPEPTAAETQSPQPSPSSSVEDGSDLDLDTLLLTEHTRITDWPANMENTPRQLILGEPIVKDAEVQPFSLPDSIHTRGAAFDFALQHLLQEIPELADLDLRIFSNQIIQDSRNTSIEEELTEKRKYIYASIINFQIQPLYFGIPLNDAWYHRDISIFSREETEELGVSHCEICEMTPAQIDALPLLSVQEALDALDAYRLNGRQLPDEIVWMEPIYASIGTIDSEETYSLYWYVGLEDSSYYVNAVSGRVWCDSNEPYEY